MQYKEYKEKYGKLEAHELSNAEVLAQYRTDTAACIAAVEASILEAQIKYHYNANKQLVRATVCLETGEVLEQKIIKVEVKPVVKPNNTTIAEGALFWEVAAAKLNAEHAHIERVKAKAEAAPAKRGVKPIIVPNAVKDGIEGYSSVSEWLQAQPEVENILVGATHLNTKTVLTSYDKPIATGSLFKVLRYCDEISTPNTMELLEVSKSQAERINAVVRVVNTQLSNCRVI